MKQTAVIGIVVIVVVAVAAVAVLTMSSPAATETISLGVVMWGYHDEGLWDTSAAIAAESLASKHNVEVDYAEETGMEEIQDVLRMKADMDDLIWVHSSAYNEAVKAVAPNLLETKFVVEGDTAAISTDFSANVVSMEQTSSVPYGQFVLGAVAAKMTETKKIGVLQTFTGGVSGDLYFTGFREGVHYVDPSIMVDRVVIGGFVDPIKTRDAVSTYASAGYDIVFPGLDDESGILEAQAQGIMAVVMYNDLVSKYPDTLITCLSFNWDAGLEGAVEAIVNGTWDSYRAQNYTIPLTWQNGFYSLDSYGSMVPDTVKTYANELIDKVSSGEVVVPILYDWNESYY